MRELNALILETYLSIPTKVLIKHFKPLKVEKIETKNGKIYIFFRDNKQGREIALKKGNQLWEKGIVEDFYLKNDAIINIHQKVKT